ncbi:MAG TPA: ribonuclease HI family protein [Dissulfurispiraceae bacterium]|nr:ribonuclease HI family protein [Dissulfurispiraceae bacterium]
MGEPARLFCDGASSGNPGDSGIGAVLYYADTVVEISEYIGTTTNNVAEYTALIRGMTEARRRGISELAVCTDSELVVRQLEGRYRVKSPHLAALYNEATTLIRSFGSVTIRHVRREQNARADALAKAASLQKNIPPGLPRKKMHS